MTDRAYARISLDTERSGSIVKQRARLTRVAEGEPVWYVDESVSGAKVPFAERPAGRDLLGDLERGDRVLVTRIDRAARNVRDLLGLVERIEEAGASIVFADQNIDTAGPMGRFLLTLLGAIAELEAGIVSERVRETRESFRAEGRFGGGPIPAGLVTAPNPNGRGLVLRPDPETADVAREVVDRVLAGEPQRSLAPLLGLKEPGLSRWLRNPALAGIRPGAEVEIDPEAALVSLTTWRRLQEFLRRPVKAWTRTNGYGGALVCGECGERLYFARSKAAPDSSVYRCGRRLHEPGTPGASVTRLHADRFLEDVFTRRFGRLPVVEEVVLDSSAERDEAIALARLRLEASQEALTNAETDEEETDAFGSVREAKKALREAERLPGETVTTTVETGLTFAEVWSEADDGERTALLNRVGPWVVSPGRGLPIDEKVTWGGVPDYLEGQLS
jgi:DNA invertase Pin-like site-specific DNA recombinase